MVRVSCNKGLFIANIKNSCGKNMTDSLETTKKDKANHGLGLKSIDDVVKRHGGTIEIQRTSGTFEVFIVINAKTK
jgi:two-component system, LytTR family, sensor histidine kinase AgrC